MRGLLGIAVGLVLIGSLVYVFGELDWAAVIAVLAAVHWPVALLAAACVLAATWTKSLRWQALLSRHVQLGASRACALVLAGQLANNGLPVRVGEAARVALLDGGSAGRAYVVSTIVAEKLLDAAALLVVAALLAFTVPLPEWLRLATPALTLAGGVAVAALVWLGARLGPPWLTIQARRAFAGLGVLGQRETLTKGCAWTAISLAIGTAANWFSLVAVGVTPRLDAALLVLLALYVGGALPSPPGRLGVFQALCVAALVPFGVEPASALAFGVVHYLAVVVAPSGLGSAYLVVWAGARRRQAAGTTRTPAEHRS